MKIWLLVVALFVAASCKSREKAPAGAPSTAPKPAGSLSVAAKKSLDELLTAYETLRATLAADKTDGVGAAAAAVREAAKSASPVAPLALRAHLDSIAAATGELESAGALELARERFGELSRHVVALVAAEPALQEGRRVFECPMVAEGYNRWVQAGPGIGNPYLGSEMLTCGSAI